ncbi:uncharacterized protein LDX57_008602 [Aspergillus melleus]|uniref:uncharacterized protein n=1 Tax=Aspergillus melleus TaxID=138277 RepID=UPI001E8D786E|nr:uncharacterized protein LDX57_008602 [Aspergillus melleus]KAH8430939.1 hypothetical protein LDX57_008602 [Aspergillus melleus]
MAGRHESELEQDEIGQRLLLNHIDRCALDAPDKVVFYQVLLEESHERVLPVTYSDLRRLIDQQARWLDGLGPEGYGNNDTTIAYLGPSDLRHLLFALACNRIGSTALLLSPRNSVYIHRHLFEECGCKLLIFDHTCSDIADQISPNSTITFHALDDLADLLKNKSSHTETYPYHEIWASACGKTALVLQTSGSTGLPKPVPITHAALATIDIQQSISDRYKDGKDCLLEVMIGAKRPYQSFPFFHVAGFELTCLFIFAESCLVLGPPRRPPGIEMFRKVVEITSPDSALLAPQTVNEIAEDQDLMSTVVPSLDWILYGGGPIAERAGNAISSRTRLLNGFGTTECGSMPLYPTQARYWNCYHFHPLSGADLRPFPDSPGLYELFIVRNESNLPYQAVFHSFPDLKEFPVKDIFRRHSDKKDYWVYQGRKDDIVVLSTGEKVNPLPIQDAIAAIPEVRAALVVGNQKPYPGLLLELEFDTSPADREGPIMNRLEKALADTNFQGTRDAQINLKDTIWADPQKPLARNIKGYLRRSAIEHDYEDEINHLYARETNSLSIELDASSEETLRSGILDMSKRLVSKDDLNVDNDLFESGLDSRGAHILVTAINTALFKPREDWSKDTSKEAPSVAIVYQNPTARKLTDVLFQHVHSGIQGDMGEREFYKLLQKHVDSLSSLSPRQPMQRTPDKKKAHVLLTGSTGFVGSYILDSLSHCPEVGRITCLDRRIEDRAASSSSSSDTKGTRSSSKVEYLLGNLDQANFDLDPSICSTLCDSITVIMHCQWPVNFNRTLLSFQPNIQGVENLVRFAYGATYNPQIIFLSSIATVKQWDQNVPVPEKPLSDPKKAQTGYGQSKLLASRLLEEASKHTGTRSSIFRLGQVTGPIGRIVKQKVWPRSNWFPVLLDASRSIGCVPDSLGTASKLDWIPVDELATVITDLVVSMHSGNDNIGPSADYYHLANPKLACYKDLLPVISNRLGKEVNIVSLSEWVDRLEKSATNAGNDSNPGITLLSFFQGLRDTQNESPVVLETKHTQERLPELRKVRAVNSRYMETLLDQWGFNSHD